MFSDLQDYFGSEEEDFYPQDDLPLGDGRTDTSSWGVRRDPLKLSRSAQDALVAQGARPTQGKPKWWQALAAIGVGATGGYINAAGRTRVNSDGAVDAILAGDTPRRQAEWAAENERLRQAAGMEQQDNARRIQEYNAETGAAAAEARAEYARQMAGMRADNKAALEQRRRDNLNRPFSLSENARLIGPDNKVLVEAAPNAPPRDPTNFDPLYVINNPDKFKPEVVDLAKKEQQARIGQMNRSNIPRPDTPPAPTPFQVYSVKNQVRDEKDKKYADLETRRVKEIADAEKAIKADQALAQSKRKFKDPKAALQAAITSIEEEHVRRKNALEAEYADLAGSLGLGARTPPRYNRDGSAAQPQLPTPPSLQRQSSVPPPPPGFVIQN